MRVAAAAYNTSSSQVSTEVALLGSAEEAQALVGEKIGEAEQYEGTELPGGATVSEVEVAELDGPGDAAWRARATASLGRTEVTTSLLALSVDQVAAVVRVTKRDGVASDEELDELAQKLADRIEAVADREDISFVIAEGRAPGQIYAAAEGKISPDDIVGLARTMAQKMEGEER